jgi:hypothetical protein
MILCPQNWVKITPPVRKIRGRLSAVYERNLAAARGQLDEAPFAAA